MKREKILWNGFFNVSSLSNEDKRILVQDALNKSVYSRVDILKGWSREKCDILPSKFIELYDLSDVKLVDRFAYRGFSTDRDYEVSIVSKNENRENLFLWIYMQREDFYDLIDKYSLPKLLI